MKKILLSSAAVFAFAGAAAADVTWSGAATLGYNDEIEGGLYVDSDIDVNLSTELNNGWTAAAHFGFELVDGGGATANNGNYSVDNNFSVSLSNEMFAVTYGDTAFAAEKHWSGVTNMNEDGFSEADGETALRVDAMLGGIDLSLSGVLDNNRTVTNTDTVTTTITTTTAVAGTGDLHQLAFGATADLGGVTITAAYQEAWGGADDGQVATFQPNKAFNNGDFNQNDVMGISVAGSLGGADLKLAYADEAGENSTGISIAYPVGAVTVGAFYVVESAINDSYGLSVDYADGPLTVGVWFHDGGDEDAGINVSYDVGNGLMVYAGYSDDDGAYIAGEYDLGGGASFLASYGDDTNNPTNDEIGPQEYLTGVNLSVSLKF